MPSNLRPPDIILALFAASLFLSALQLFAVQPMFAKMLLPKLGGASSVWAVSVCFFQVALLAGYAYAHAIDRYLRPPTAASVHVLVLVAVVAVLPITLPAAWSEPPSGEPYAWLVGALSVGVGLPFFALAATAPLLQAWFARTGHEHARDPYFLYGASNLGSLLALLLYPAVVEPALGLASQSQFWTTGFVMLFILIIVYATITLSARSDAAPLPNAPISAEPASPDIGWRRRFGWLFLSLVPSALIIAATNHITTDIAAVPLLWVIPLAFYLLTFVIVFRDRPLIPQWLPLILQPILVAAALGTLHTYLDIRLLYGSGIIIFAFFATALVAHRELYLLRPAASQLTEFYLWLSLGGVLGGIFSALVAPQIFSSVVEFPTLLLLGLAGRPSFRRPPETPDAWLQMGLALVPGCVLLAIGSIAEVRQLWTFRVGPGAMVLGLLSILAVGASLLWRGRFEPALLALIAVAFVVVPPVRYDGDSVRGFFGAYRIYENYEFRLLFHGTTLHGAQRIRTTAGGSPEKVAAISYYHPGSAFARGVGAARMAHGGETAAIRIGTIGLGTGTMACNSEERDTVRFFEIDPLMVAVARERFGFISHCRPDVDIVLGDARISMAKEPSQSFDYILVDAFSSDAVPVHLLTLDAVRLYLHKLSPKGLLALNVTNRHLDLVTVASDMLPYLAGVAAVYVNEQGTKGTAALKNDTSSR